MTENEIAPQIVGASRECSKVIDSDGRRHVVLNGIHLLLTYACTNECDHCFLHCSPEARGTFTCEQLRRVFEEVERVGTVRTVYGEE